MLCARWCETCGELILNGTGVCAKCSPSPRTENRRNVREMVLDADGQPARALNSALRRRRSVDEVLGFLRGIVADGEVSEPEVVSLAKWLCGNAERDEWPIDVLVNRVNRVMADDRVDAEELAELKEFFLKIVGPRGTDTGESAATRLPLTDPAPVIEFPSRTFVLTGKFIYGTRRTCESSIMTRGGLCADSVTIGIDYLVIGELGSRDWIHTPHGRKIERAVEYVRKGRPISIIDEEHWAKFVK